MPASSIKHLVPLQEQKSSEPPWATELKTALCRLVDLAVIMTSANHSQGYLHDTLTAEELSAKLKLPKSTILEMARSGKLPGFRIGKHWRFDIDAVREYLHLSNDV